MKEGKQCGNCAGILCRSRALFCTQCCSRARESVVRVAADGDGDRRLTWKYVEVGSDALVLLQAVLHLSAIEFHFVVHDQSESWTHFLIQFLI